MGNVRHASLMKAIPLTPYRATRLTRRSTDDTLQGAKAQQKRDRNQKDTKVAKSQTKVVCKTPYHRAHPWPPRSEARRLQPDRPSEPESLDHPVPGLQGDVPPDHQGPCVSDNSPTLQPFARLRTPSFRLEA